MCSSRRCARPPRCAAGRFAFGRLKSSSPALPDMESLRGDHAARLGRAGFFCAGHRPIPPDEAARLCDSGKGRFRREADLLETQGRRPQANRVATGHPCAGYPTGSVDRLQWVNLSPAAFLKESLLMLGTPPQRASTSVSLARLHKSGRRQRSEERRFARSVGTGYVAKFKLFEGESAP